MKKTITDVNDIALDDEATFVWPNGSRLTGEVIGIDIDDVSPTYATIQLMLTKPTFSEDGDVVVVSPEHFVSSTREVPDAPVLKKGDEVQVGPAGAVSSGGVHVAAGCTGIVALSAISNDFGGAWVEMDRSPVRLMLRAEDLVLVSELVECGFFGALQPGDVVVDNGRYSTGLATVRREVQP